MTVSTTHISNTLAGTGSAVAFNFTFHALKTTEIQVSLAGVVQTTGFTTTLYQDQESTPGGTVTFTTAPALDAVVLIERVTALIQETSFNRESLLNTENLESAMDRLTLLLQEAAARTRGETGADGPEGPQGDPGDVTGPVSTTDGALALWDGTGGNLLTELAPGSEGDILQVVGGVWAATAGAASIPSGMIALWDTNMASIPTGWAAMDGSSVTINGVLKATVDTRGKYVLAAAANDTGSSGYTGSTVRPGTVSGTKTHQHVQAGTFASQACAAGFHVNVTASGASTVTRYDHTHNTVISGNTNASSEAARPMECAFLLIIKVDE